MPALKELEIARIEGFKEELYIAVSLLIACPGQVPGEYHQKKEDRFGELRAET